MNLRALLVVSALLPAGAALAQPAPVPCETGGPTGGVVTEAGECDGTDAIFCGQDGNVQRVPCADLATDGSIPAGVCEVYEGFGSWCAFQDGNPCAFNTDNGTVGFACETDSSACIGGVCTAGDFACTPTPPGETPAASCLSPANLGVGCEAWGQAAVIACSGVSDSSTCSGDVCAGVAVGDPCADGVAECEEGVDCVGASADSAGTCGGAAEGEGEGEGDGGGGGRTPDENPEPAPSGCLNASGVVPVATPVALVLVVASMLRRRRRA